MASTVRVPSVPLICRLSTMVATPGTVMVVFGAGWSDSAISPTWPLTMLAPPVTRPVLGSKLHADVTARTCRSSSTDWMSTRVDDALVASAVSLLISARSRAPRLTVASVTGDTPGWVASATGGRLTTPVASAP